MNKLKKIIHIADVHVYNVKRHDEYREVLQQFIDEVRIINEEENGDVAVLIAGDFFHQKIQISNELSIFTSWFIREVSKICDVLIYAGNHDCIVDNNDRLDTVSGILEVLQLDNVYYLDKILNFKSGLYEYRGFTFALYSIFDGFNIPDLVHAKTLNQPIIGLFHGAIVGAVANGNYTIEHGKDCGMFIGCDVVMAGDIHKRQEIKHKGVKIVYPGSVIQQDYGENLSEHGYLVWDMKKLKYTEHDLDNPYEYYKFKIDDINDIVNDKEVLINY